MDPFTAALIIAAIGTGTSIYMNQQAKEAQEAATDSANNKTKFAQEAEAKRTQQLANTAAANSKRRTALVKKQPNAAQGPAGQEIATGTQGLTTSNGGVNPQSGSAGTF